MIATDISLVASALTHHAAGHGKEAPTEAAAADRHPHRRAVWLRRKAPEQAMDYNPAMGDKSILDRLELTCFTISASGLAFHNALRGPPPKDENLFATVSIADTATPKGEEVIRGIIGSTADEILASHPERFVIYVLWRDNKAWVRLCASEELVIAEVLKLVRQPPEPPATVDVLLFLEPEFHLRVNKAVADEALKRSETGGSA
jgi:hypothetical protein